MSFGLFVCSFRSLRSLVRQTCLQNQESPGATGVRSAILADYDRVLRSLGPWGLGIVRRPVVCLQLLELLSVRPTSGTFRMTVGSFSDSRKSAHSCGAERARSGTRMGWEGD